MTSKNNITGDTLISKSPTEDYYKGWNLLWGSNSGSTVGVPRITDEDIITLGADCNDTCTICKFEGC